MSLIEIDYDALSQGTATLPAPEAKDGVGKTGLAPRTNPPAGSHLREVSGTSGRKP